MKKILEELWYENICPNTQCNKLSAEAKQLMSYVTKHHDSLWETLSEKQQEMFENFNNFLFFFLRSHTKRQMNFSVIIIS